MKDLKIEAGKFYRTREGGSAIIAATDAGGDYPVHGVVFFDGGMSITAWTPGGLNMIGGVTGSDLIFECKQTIDDIGFDKSCLPKWAKYIFMDAAGKWFWSEEKPTHLVYYPGRYCWDVCIGLFGMIPAEHAPKNYQGDWKDSLFEIE